MHSLKKKHNGAIAQLVEQRTENPCVPGSIPGGTTYKESFFGVTLFCIYTCYTQLAEQRTDIVYKLALCPRFDSWWYHDKKQLREILTAFLLLWWFVVVVGFDIGDYDVLAVA